MASSDKSSKTPKSDRRDFIAAASSVAMAGGLAAGYGVFGTVAGRYLYPNEAGTKDWVFVTEIDRLKVGESLVFRAPAGASATIARRGQQGTAADFVALSSICPHLGCQVHWQGDRNRFFCPCHNGIFDATGKATGGPPAEAGQSLLPYPLKVESGLLFMEVSLEELAGGEPWIEEPEPAYGPGHDPCLCKRAKRG